MLSLEQLWKGFDSKAKLFIYQTKCIDYYNVFCKQFDWNEHFLHFELSAAAIKICVWINSAGLNNLGQSYLFKLGSAHEKIGVWTGPNIPKPKFNIRIWATDKIQPQNYEQIL